MDLISSLSSELGVDSEKAQGLAGAALGMLQGQVSEKLGGAEAEQMRAQIPELEGWAQKAKALGGGGLGGLMGAAGSLLGGRAGAALDTGALLQMATKAGASAGAAQKLLPLVSSFLKSKLDPALLEKVMGAVPMLKGVGAGGLTGALGGSPRS